MIPRALSFSVALLKIGKEKKSGMNFSHFLSSDRKETHSVILRGRGVRANNLGPIGPLHFLPFKCVLPFKGGRHPGPEFRADLHWGVVVDLSAVRTQPAAGLLSL